MGDLQFAEAVSRQTEQGAQSGVSVTGGKSMILRWFLSPQIVETVRVYRENKAIRQAEKSDTRELSGEQLIEELRRRGW